MWLLLLKNPRWRVLQLALLAVSMVDGYCPQVVANRRITTRRFRFSLNVEKDLSASQRERRDEDKRRQKRKADVVIGKTSAKAGEKNFALNPRSTEELWLKQASPLEREIHAKTELGMQSLRMLDLDKAARSFERVYDLKPNAYVWQAGIAYYYLGNFKRASEIFAQSAEFYESRFGDYASEERIWRNACELKYLSQLNRNQKRALQESNAMAQHINPAPTRDLDSEPLEPERRKVIRIAKDLFDASTCDDHSGTVLARAKLRSVGGSANMVSDIKMWKLNSWFYLGLHYDAVGEDDESKKCMKTAFRLCPNGAGRAQDLIHTLPLMHMATREWFDDDEFEAIDPTASTSTIDPNSVSMPGGGKAADPLLVQSIRDDIAKLKLAQLQDAMKARGLPRTGTKDELAERLFHILLEDVGLV